MGFTIFGIILVIVGGILVIRTFWIYNLLGPIPFVEEKLRPTITSHMAYKLIGLLAVFIGFLMVFDLFGDFFRAIMPDVLFGG